MCLTPTRTLHLSTSTTGHLANDKGRRGGNFAPIDMQMPPGHGGISFLWVGELAYPLFTITYVPFRFAWRMANPSFTLVDRMLISPVG